MSDWAELEPEIKKTGIKAPVRFGLSKIRGNRAKGVVLILREVIDQLGMKNWRCRVHLGKGARMHQIAIVPDE